MIPFFIALICDLIFWTLFQAPYTRFLLMLSILQRKKLLLSLPSITSAGIMLGIHYFLIYGSTILTIYFLIFLYGITYLLHHLLLEKSFTSTCFIGFLILITDFFFLHQIIYYTFPFNLFTFVCIGGNVLILCCMHGKQGNRIA